ncbi:MAG TPA: hypothetical protein VI072_11370 [Polyangiaceae bacterium]
MTKEVSAPPADWDPTAPRVLADQRTAYDELRSRCPVARDASGTWLLTGHEPVRRAALDDATFSNAVSRFRNVPNSMDGDEHRRFRAVIDRFFEPQRLAALVPSFRQVGEEAVAALPRNVTIDAVHDLRFDTIVRDQVVSYRPDANAAHNLVYGLGRHVCPGRGLATHEMREAVAALLRATTTVALASNEPCVRETPPVSGYARVPVILRS